MFKIKKDPHLFGAKKGMPVKGGSLFGSHKQEASLSTVPKAKAEEDAVVGRTRTDCKRIARRQPEENSTFSKPKRGGRTRVRKYLRNKSSAMTHLM